MTPPDVTTRVRRLGVWRAIWLSSPRRLVLLMTLVVLIALSDVFRMETLPPAALERLPGWPWWGWALVVLALLSAIVLEGAYRAIVRRHREMARQIEAVELENIGLRSRLDASRKLHHVRGHLLSAADVAERIVCPDQGRAESDPRQEAAQWQSDTASLVEEALGVRARRDFLRNGASSTAPSLPDTSLPIVRQLLEHRAAYLRQLARQLRPLDVLPDFVPPRPDGQGAPDRPGRLAPGPIPARGPLGLAGEGRPARGDRDGPRTSPRSLPKAAAP